MTTVSSLRHMSTPDDTLTTSEPLPGFDLVETMLWFGELPFGWLHFDRLAASATHFGWPFDRAAAAALVATRAKALRPTTRFQVDLRLTANGSMHVRVDRLRQAERCGLVRFADKVTKADDEFRRHQTTCRTIYDQMVPRARREKLDDFIFVNDRGEVTEGAVHTLFIKCGKKLLTPPVDSGVLPGVYRRLVLETNPCAEEQILRPSDVLNADALYLSNSLVGMYPVELVTPSREGGD